MLENNVTVKNKENTMEGSVDGVILVDAPKAGLLDNKFVKGGIIALVVAGVTALAVKVILPKIKKSETEEAADTNNSSEENAE